MPHYCVNMNAQSNGDHEVHTSTCNYLPDARNQLQLGYFDNCGPAVRKAKETYARSNGCYFCCNACHTS